MGYHTPILPPKWVLRRIRNTLTYYPKTGKLIWTNPIGNNIKLGDLAGSINSQGYLQICFSRNRQRFNIKVHHICWFLYYGEWPPKEVDHNDTNTLNNKIRNLRLANRRQAVINRGLAINNTSGATGVNWSFLHKKWRVRIGKRKRIHVGMFDDFNQAVRARRQAEKQHFGRWRYSG